MSMGHNGDWSYLSRFHTLFLYIYPLLYLYPT